jgi:hypothetical protein
MSFSTTPGALFASSRFIFATPTLDSIPSAYGRQKKLFFAKSFPVLEKMSMQINYHQKYQ